MGLGSWGKKGRGSWSGNLSSVKPAIPVLDATSPQRHGDALIPVQRDDAPPDVGTPEFLLSRAEWLAAGGAQPIERDQSDPGSHRQRGPHDVVTSELDGTAPRQLAFAHTDLGGHRPGEIPPGAGGPASGRLDNALPYGNQGGYPLGTDYVPQAMQRAMGTGRMRGALRAIGQWQPETGDNPSPPPGGRTSPFDAIAPRKGFGPEPTTRREVLRPAGDQPAEYPEIIATTGRGWQL